MLDPKGRVFRYLPYLSTYVQIMLHIVDNERYIAGVGTGVEHKRVGSWAAAH